MNGHHGPPTAERHPVRAQVGHAVPQLRRRTHVLLRRHQHVRGSRGPLPIKRRGGHLHIGVLGGVLVLLQRGGAHVGRTLDGVDGRHRHGFGGVGHARHLGRFNVVEPLADLGEGVGAFGAEALSGVVEAFIGGFGDGGEELGEGLLVGGDEAYGAWSEFPRYLEM